MGEMRKVTMNLPAELLERAQLATGKGVTETVRLGLQQLARAKAYEAIRAMRGKVHLNVDYAQLKEDRD